MATKIKIRKATALDIVKIFRLMGEAKDSQPIRVGKTDANRAFQFVLAMIQDSYVVVADLGGNLVGVLALSAFRPPWSTDFILNGEAFYIQPSHRQGGVPRALVSAALKEARRVNVDLRLHLSDMLLGMIGADTLIELGMKPTSRVFTVGRQDDAERTSTKPQREPTAADPIREPEFIPADDESDLPLIGQGQADQRDPSGSEATPG